MISVDIYNALLNEYGSTSSWAVWSSPSDGNWKSKNSVFDMSPFHNISTLLESLSGDFIFVGLNPAVHDNSQHLIGYWENFHSADSKRSQDYKLRYALHGTRYWGSFMTDLYTDIVDTDSDSALKKVTAISTTQSVRELLKIRKMLGDKSVIVAMGGKAYEILKKSLPNDIPLKMIMHYSAYVNIDKYRESVLNSLRD